MDTPGRIAHYEIDERLADRREARVFRVSDPQGEGSFILKQMFSPPDLPPEEASRQRHDLITAARHWAQSPVANTLPIIDAGELADGVYLVTPWHPEPTLEPLLPYLARDTESALYVLRSLAEVIDRLHRAGIVHRSLKLSNVFVQDDGSVLLSDALVLASCSSELMGSEPPLARAVVAGPEQVMGFRQTPASNRYVFATLAYRLLTGESVFPLDDVVDYLYGTVYRVPRPARELRPALPEQFDALLAWGLDKEPSARPVSCMELVEALGRAYVAEASSVTIEAPASAVAAELPWEVDAAPQQVQQEPDEIQEAIAAEPAEELLPAEPAEELLPAEPAPRRWSGDAELLASLRGAWEQPRPIGGWVGVSVVDPVDEAIELHATHPEPEPDPASQDAPDEPDAADRSDLGEASATARGHRDWQSAEEETGESPRLQLLKPISARSPAAAPAIGASDQTVRYGRNESRARESAARRWFAGRGGWFSRLSVAGARPRDLEDRESYLADWRRGIDHGLDEVSTPAPVVPSWPLRVEVKDEDAELFVDGAHVAPVPGTVNLQGKSGTVVQLEIRADERIVAARELRLHPLMDAVWSVGNDSDDLRTEG